MSIDNFLVSMVLGEHVAGAEQYPHSFTTERKPSNPLAPTSVLLVHNGKGAEEHVQLVFVSHASKADESDSHRSVEKGKVDC